MSSTAGWEDDFDVLPDTTTDESDIGWGDDKAADRDDDSRLTAERPPHWD